MKTTYEILKQGYEELRAENYKLREQRDRLAFQLRAAANYVDALGGTSKSYRAILAEIEGEKK